MVCDREVPNGCVAKHLGRSLGLHPSEGQLGEITLPRRRQHWKPLREIDFRQRSSTWEGLNGIDDRKARTHRIHIKG